MAEKPQEQAFVSRAKLARLFGVTPRYISMLVEHGMPQVSRGAFDFGRCGMWYCRFLTSALNRRGLASDAIVGQLRKDRIRLVTAQAEKAKLDFAKFEATLIERDKFREWEGSVNAAIREELTAMAHRVAPQLINKNRNQIKALIDSEARATLTTISSAVGA